MESYIQNIFAQRIGGRTFGKDKTLYKFQKIKLAKELAKKTNPDKKILDFGVGEPDAISPAVIRKALSLEINDIANRGYADNGIEEFKEAARDYMQNVFGVSLNASTQINHTIGSKPGLAMFPTIFINPKDITIMTIPGYPVLGTNTKWLNGEVYNVPLTKENNFLPNLNLIPDSVSSKAKILVLNYPNNPTGANATFEFYKEVVAYARKYNIVVVQDAAYAALTYSKPLSFLSIPGAMDVGVEFHSLSKSYNMTGYRIGFVCGNELIVKGFSYVKDNIDSGQFIPIQKAAIEGLKDPKLTEDIYKKYKRRLNALVKTLKQKGFSAKMPDGTFYLFVEAPKGIKGSISFKSGEDLSQWLIKEKLISTVPWDDTGNFIRFSATFAASGIEEEEAVLKDFGRRLEDVEFIF